MKANLTAGVNIYLQIAQFIEDDILAGNLKEEDLVPSTNQLARLYMINPATAAKGLNMLADEGILYKKRGIGMCVSPQAKGIIERKRKKLFIEERVIELLREAEKLSITKDELIEIIRRGDYDEHGN